MATEKKATVKNFTRSYDDKGNKVEIGHGDETLATIDLSAVHAKVGAKAMARYLADIVVGSGNAAMKAEGGTVEKAQAKMAETIKALTDGSFTFRSASGSASLSLEDEQRIIAETLVTMKKVADVATALGKVQALYAKTKTAANGNTTRPDYNALRNIPKIKEALDAAAPASDTDDKLEALGFASEKEEPATDGQPTGGQPAEATA